MAKGTKKKAPEKGEKTRRRDGFTPILVIVNVILATAVLWTFMVRKAPAEAPPAALPPKPAVPAPAPANPPVEERGEVMELFGLEPLREAFNADPEAIRLVEILSPG